MSPAGDFLGKSSKIQGFATKQGAKIVAENILIPVASIDTGMALRNQHMKDKYLEAGRFPYLKLIKGEGEGGQGKGLFEVRGKQKEIPGTYEVIGQEVKAQFVVKISDFVPEKIKYMGLGVNDDVRVTIVAPLR